MQGKTINGYTLQYKLGEGGMAEVWYAENEIGKPAAVKVLNESLSHNTQIVERFHNEALVMVKLNHPNIRQVYGYGYLGNRHCIIMEYLEGNDLEALLKSGRRFTDMEIRHWWDQTVDALNYTHAMNIVHRDIKPSNLFLDSNGNIKLLDFGIAKVKESMSMTRTGMMMGTLMYMSPEQVKDPKRVGAKSDAYSLAVSFVHLLQGKPVYDADTDSDFDIQLNIVSKPVDLSSLPSAWQGFLAPYLEKDPDMRPPLRHFEAVAGTPKAATPAAGAGTVVGGMTPNGSSFNGVRPSESAPLSTEHQKKHKSMIWLWIVLAALFVVGVVSFVLVNNKLKQDRIEAERNAMLMEQRNAKLAEENCFNSCSSLADYQDYLNRYPNGMYAAQASNKIEELRRESLESGVRSFIQDFIRLTEASSEQEIYSLVSKLYAPSVKRYHSAYDVGSSYVADCYKNYDEKFGVYGKHCSVRWNTVSFYESNGSIWLTYVEDYTIDRYDSSKYSVFVLEKHFELNKDFKVLSVYDVQLSKSKR